jgi:hypothetical protein
MSHTVFDPTKLRIIEFRVVSADISCQSPIFGFNAASKFNVGLELGTDYDHGIVKITIHINLEATNPTTQEEARLKVSTIVVFNVSELMEFVNLGPDGKVILDTQLAYSIAGIAYSTSRGLLSSQTNNTFFSGFVIPVININDLFKPLLNEEPKS